MWWDPTVRVSVIPMGSFYTCPDMIHVGPDILPVKIIPMIVVTIIILIWCRHLKDLLESFKFFKWIMFKDPPPGIHVHKLIRIAFFIPIREVIALIVTSERWHLRNFPFIIWVFVIW